MSSRAGKEALEVTIAWLAARLAEDMQRHADAEAQCAAAVAARAAAEAAQAEALAAEQRAHDALARAQAEYDRAFVTVKGV
ncbi:hypothetical protein JKP88DRAFT_278266 [Tribonema minus]|uniref:Uncharacterized protein n=1 Tax=Tribonema minus TaxID=303371 RepID=A0A835YZF2_9STRA|nr:hypothetical protein JKP88DRAFT_278266 [Tribonema minus]